MKIKSSSEVEDVFNAYPKAVQKRMLELRSLVIESAEEMENLELLEECLRWNEPSYITKHGSTLRMDWKQKLPNRVALYFKCTSSLVANFKLIYGDKFEYEKNRAILLPLEGDLPEYALKHCVQLSFNYHKIKHLPMLGG